MFGDAQGEVFHFIPKWPEEEDDYHVRRQVSTVTKATTHWRKTLRHLYFSLSCVKATKRCGRLVVLQGGIGFESLRCCHLMKKETCDATASQ